MSELPANVAQVLIADLSKENPALYERQVRVDLAHAVAITKEWERELVAKGREKPGPLAILARELTMLYAAYGNMIPGQTKTGGPGPQMLVTLANGADLLDPRTGASYTLQSARNTLKETMDRLNKRVGLKPTGQFITANPESNSAPDIWTYNEETYGGRHSEDRENTRVVALKAPIVGYEDLEGNPVSENDPDGWPVFGGYEVPKPRLPAAETFTNALAKLSKD